MFWDEMAHKDETQKAISDSLGDISGYLVGQLKSVPQLVITKAINSAPTAEQLVNGTKAKASTETIAKAGSTPPAASSALSPMDTIKKYLPWIMGAIAVIFVLYFATKKR